MNVIKSQRRLLALEQRAAAANYAPGVITEEELAELEATGLLNGKPLPDMGGRGFFVVPGAISEEDWEKAARIQQAALTGQS